MVRHNVSKEGRAAQAAGGRVGGKADGARKRRPPEHYQLLGRRATEAAQARARAAGELLAAVNEAGALLSDIGELREPLESRRRAVLDRLGAAFDAAAAVLGGGFFNGAGDPYTTAR